MNVDISAEFIITNRFMQFKEGDARVFMISLKKPTLT